MKSLFSRSLVSRTVRLTAAAALATVCVGAFAWAATTAEPETVSYPVDQSRTVAEMSFPDAPLGVDPVVTGPRTKAFAEKQKQLGCDTAQWPNIPASCFPK